MTWKFYLGMMILCLMVQGFYAMIEMASVSFNKVRLQYYISRGSRRAIWLSYLLNHPAQLFGTTLICINLALLVGSEASRHFYHALGLSPDFAPISQLFLVLIFAEISPMFAGRRYAEHAVMLGIPILYATSVLLRPLIWLLDLLCLAFNKLLKNEKAAGLYLTREELQKVIEEQEVLPSKPEQTEFDTIVGRIFTLKNKRARELMKPLSSVPLAPSTYTIGEMRTLLRAEYSPFLPIYQKTPENIVAIAYPRDLLRFDEKTRIRDHARPPWFITENTSILQILKQFQRNNKSVAVVLNEAGLARGILTLDEIIDEIFGHADEWPAFEEMIPRMHHVILDRTFDGDMRIVDFNAQFHVRLPEDGAETLSELIVVKLGHLPSKGESIRLDQFELTVEEASLLGVKSINVRTIY